MTAIFGKRETVTVRDVSSHPGVRLITLNRPDARNAFTADMYDAFATALQAAQREEVVKVVVVTGAGSAFCAGHDPGQAAGVARQRTAEAPVSGGRPALLELLSNFDKPLLMAVNGPAVGWGFSLVLHADVVIVAESASMMAPFAQHGLPPEAASSYLLPARVGWQRAAHIMMTGEWISAEEAVEWGLALDCVADDAVVLTALRTAVRMALASTASLRDIKNVMRAWERPFVHGAIRAESATYEVSVAPSRNRQLA